ncbi:KAP family P-loop NTPase fold protein [Pontivivens ytuae]|uniref:KAP NTPase domain-containing protein n=1 Tax=Pontivivens ytuae TaxID=2789856 RepID=A0A7S9LTU1_9RHOB|nr:P-loop NTPase fold protein [Pontivivens ytuae]QPH55154.1 hypothetical protein I0K15_05250 [Pontivivens ytuae]
MEKINDVLGRSEDAETVARFAAARATGPQGLVLNVDAAWGMGKTTFLRLLKKRLGDDAVMVNAWESDFADDPLLPVLKAVTEALRSGSGSAETVANSLLQKGSRMALTIGKGMAKQVGRKMIGEAVEEVAEQIGETGAEITEAGLSAALDEASTALIARFETQQKTVTDFKEALVEAVKDRDTPLHILIDELDRCRPTYAIEMLERIKHLFGVRNVAFVIATDTEQLQHSIRAVYGEGFDAKAYLRRFFDRTYRFDEGSLQGIILNSPEASIIRDAELPMPHDVDPLHVLEQMLEAQNASLRDARQCLTIIADTMHVWDKPVPLNLAVLIPLIVIHQQGFHTEFNDIEREAWRGEEGVQRALDAHAKIFAKPIHLGVPRYTQGDEEYPVALTLETYFRNVWSLRGQQEKLAETGLPKAMVALLAQDIDEAWFQISWGPTINDEHVWDCAFNYYPALIRKAGRLS